MGLSREELEEAAPCTWFELNKQKEYCIKTTCNRLFIIGEGYEVGLDHFESYGIELNEVKDGQRLTYEKP